MGWLERQARLEERVHEYIDELAELLSLPVTFYPEVIWVGEKHQKNYFEKTRLPLIYREVFLRNRLEGGSTFLPRIRTIVIGENSLDNLTEEASHALHWMSRSNSNYFFTGLPVFSMTLEEMSGFLGSKLLNPSRKNTNPFAADALKVGTDNIAKKFFKNEEDKFFFLYQQGYGLADRVYYAFMEEEISKKELRQVYLSTVKNEKEAFWKFLKLRERFWPLPKRITQTKLP